MTYTPVPSSDMDAGESPTSDRNQDVSMRTVALKLRKLRTSQGLSARELAERCVVDGEALLSRSTIAKIESGVRSFITLDELAILARGLGVSPQELASEEEPANLPMRISEQADETPPHDIESEQRVLGGMLSSRDAIADVRDICSVNDFYRPAHSVIFGTVVRLFEESSYTDAISVAAELELHGELLRAGGTPYLKTLSYAWSDARNTAIHAERVADLADLRRLAEAGAQIRRLALNSRETDDPATVYQNAQVILEQAKRRHTDVYAPLEDVLQPIMDEIDAIASRHPLRGEVPFGIRELDELTLGMRDGQLIWVAGRPGSGKTSLLHTIARAISVQLGQTSVVFSLDNSRTDVVMRFLAAESSIELDDMRGGTMSDAEWNRLAKRMTEVSERPFFIDDSPTPTIEEIRSKSKRLLQEHDLKLILVDSAHLIRPTALFEGRDASASISEVSRRLKELARELNVPVIASTRLYFSDAHPTDEVSLQELSSGEQDADMVILIHDSWSQDATNTKLSVAQNRNGRRGSVDLLFERALGKFA